MTDCEVITLDQIEAASRRIAADIERTPCVESSGLSELTGCRVFCKLENLQRTGSFKERGVVNAMAALTDEQRRRGLIAASAGNHALAMAFHGQRLGIPITVVMPRHAPLIKVATCRRFGARVELRGDGFVAAREHAGQLGAELGLTYLHGYDDPQVIAGQGTLALELIDQVPQAEVIIVPVGGAGLIAGMATAVKALRPSIQVIAVEPRAMAGFARSLEAGQVVEVPIQPTLADGLAVGSVGPFAFAAARPHVDRTVEVDESHLALAMLRLMELEKTVVEGAGAAPLAALLSGQLADLRGRCVVLPLCGGNVDPLKLCRIIEIGMAADGRLGQFQAVISDRPGGLAALTDQLARAGASIQDIHHDRIFAGPDVSSVRIRCVIETHDQRHLESVRDALIASPYVQRVRMNPPIADQQPPVPRPR